MEIDRPMEVRTLHLPSSLLGATHTDVAPCASVPLEVQQHIPHQAEVGVVLVDSLGAVVLREEVARTEADPRPSWA